MHNLKFLLIFAEILFRSQIPPSHATKRRLAVIHLGKNRYFAHNQRTAILVCILISASGH